MSPGLVIIGRIRFEDPAQDIQLVPKDNDFRFASCSRLEFRRQKVEQELQAVPHRRTLSEPLLLGRPDGVSDRDNQDLEIDDLPRAKRNKPSATGRAAQPSRASALRLSP